MIAAAMMGGLALVMMQIMKSQTNTSVQSGIDADVSQLKSELQAILNNPANCNANFYGKIPPLADVALAQINQCDTFVAGACKPGAPVALTKFTPDASATWSANSYSKRVRIKSMTLSITNTVAPGGAAPLVLTNATIKVTIQKRLLNNTIVDLPERPFEFNTIVVKDNTPVVVGCPKSWNSTVVY